MVHRETLLQKRKIFGMESFLSSLLPYLESNYSQSPQEQSHDTPDPAHLGPLQLLSSLRPSPLGVAGSALDLL